MMLRSFSFLVLMMTFITCASAAPVLPYAKRSKDFSAWTPASRGDLNTVGMGSATIATPSSIAAAEANPAGFSMQTQSLTAQINKTAYEDKRIQRSGESIESLQWGLGVSPFPWGFSFSYYSPLAESGTYVSPNTGRGFSAEASVKDYRITAARSLFQGAVALGASMDTLKAVRELNDRSYNRLKVSWRMGVLWRAPSHLVLGAAYNPGTTIAPSGEELANEELPGFNRSIVLPEQMGIGFGWVPNRFFKIGGRLDRVNATENTALLADESVLTGTRPTLVPRMGLSYVLAEYRDFKLEGAAGSYYDVSRLSGRANRLHVTSSIEANIYFLNLGAGFDLARDYKNIMTSVGMDIVRALRNLKIIPPDPVPPYKGVFPPATKLLSDGLPEGFTQGEKQKHRAPNVKEVEEIIEGIPGKISEKLF